MDKNSPWIKWFDDITLSDIPQVGGKNASLGEMYQQLRNKGIEVPYGFAITAQAYAHFLAANDLVPKLHGVLKDLNVRDIPVLAKAGQKARELILNASFPRVLVEEIKNSYKDLMKKSGVGPVAVRSSATAEDLPEASFAGAQETYLNISDEEALIKACLHCFASLFTDRAISYRQEKGFDHMQVMLSIGIQKMVQAGTGASGVMFSIDTESGFEDVVLISATYGYGESLVQGSINPDEYYVFKPTLKKGFSPILQKILGTKENKLINDPVLPNKLRSVAVSQAEARLFALKDEEILQLARWALIIEEHYSERMGRKNPVDIEWAKDGQNGRIYIVQARPETVHAQKTLDYLTSYQLKEKGKVLLDGRSVGQKIASGTVQIISSIKELHTFKAGSILVTERTDPDWEPAMKLASAIITDRGGRTCHAAIVARELGIPAVVGTITATKVLRFGQEVTVSCAEGEIGRIYDGLLNFEVIRTEFASLKRPKTKIMMNIANPHEALRLSFIPNDGAGLVREEFIISSFIKIHPLALLYPERVTNEKERKKIEELTCSYQEKPDFFIDKLASGIGMIAAAFYPKDVIVRLSDFKSNEYANLIGGSVFEPKEENPMIGFRGASRYYDPRYEAAFALECAALDKVRKKMGLHNVKIMVPFCRTPEEAQKVIAVLAKYGLKQKDNGLELYMMCEVPSNVILADEFAKIFDGFSIGSNDLTQLVLGLDRDSEIIAHLFDERNEAVKRMISTVIDIAHKNNIKIGICGEAPSDYPEFAEFLVKHGIDSLSLSPDAILKTTQRIFATEKSQSRTYTHPATKKIIKYLSNL